MKGWLETADCLLGEDDPGDTPFLVERLVVDRSILALVGPPKVGKTFALLELAVSIVTGRPAFEALDVREGPVVLVLEESGRTALHRRLLALCRGRGIETAELGDLHFAANRGVRLDRDQTTFDSWHKLIRAAAERVRPTAILFDPLSRVKGAVDENAQGEMAEVLDYLRELRERHECTVGFVHHTGHTAPGRMRGTSDLEAYWESKITIARSGDRCTLTAEHRESEATEPIDYRVTFGEGSLRMQLDLDSGSIALRRQIEAWLAEHPDSTLSEIRAGVGKNNAACRSRILELQSSGAVESRRSSRPDRNGVRRPVTLYNLAPQAGLTAFQDSQNGSERDPSADPAEDAVPVPAPYKRAGPGTASVGGGVTEAAT